jgi:hypothetical protein
MTWMGIRLSSGSRRRPQSPESRHSLIELPLAPNNIHNPARRIAPSPTASAVLPSQAQRVRRAPQDRRETASCRTPFCASSSMDQAAYDAHRRGCSWNSINTKEFPGSLRMMASFFQKTSSNASRNAPCSSTKPVTLNTCASTYRLVPWVLEPTVAVRRNSGSRTRWRSGRP